MAAPLTTTFFTKANLGVPVLPHAQYKRMVSVCPGAMKTPSATSDLKVGGSYTVEMKGEMEGELVNPSAGGTYKKIIPNERQNSF